MERQKIIRVVFYSHANGTEPVREWLKDLCREDMFIIGSDLKTVEFGWPIGMPICKSLKNGLWEVRCNLTSKNIARVLFLIHANEMVLLHGFIKKTRTTPDKEMNLALNRMRRFLSNEQTK